MFDVLARMKLIHVPDDSILPRLSNDKVPKENIRLSRASAISRSLFSLRFSSTSTKSSTRMCLGSRVGPQSISIKVSGLATISSGLRSAATPQRHATEPPSTISSEPSK
jgi:hypothetical protein